MEKICRICQSTEPEDDLRDPCLCLGSIRYIHLQCLTRWVTQRYPNLRRARCEICGARFKMRVEKLSWFHMLTRLHRTHPHPMRVWARYIFKIIFHVFYSRLLFRQFKQDIILIVRELVANILSRHPSHFVLVRPESVVQPVSKLNQVVAGWLWRLFVLFARPIRALIALIRGLRPPVSVSRQRARKVVRLTVIIYLLFRLSMICCLVMYYTAILSFDVERSYHRWMLLVRRMEYVIKDVANRQKGTTSSTNI
eukprot:225653_1